MKRHPMQPIVVDEQGVVRFKRNAIVDFLLKWCAAQNGAVGYPKLPTPGGNVPDLNTLSLMDFSDEDWTQLAQLIGYSVSGFGDLNYVSDKDFRRAERKAKKVK